MGDTSTYVEGKESQQIKILKGEYERISVRVGTFEWMESKTILFLEVAKIPENSYTQKLREIKPGWFEAWGRKTRFYRF